MSEPRSLHFQCARVFCVIAQVRCPHCNQPQIAPRSGWYSWFVDDFELMGGKMMDCMNKECGRDFMMLNMPKGEV